MTTINSNLVEAQREARSAYTQQMLDLYKKRRDHLQGRAVEFIKRDTSAQADLAAMTAGGILSGAAAGAVVGGITGGICGIPAGPPGMVLGGGLGAGLGACVGGIIGFGAGVAYLYPRYQKFLATEEGKRFGGELRVFLSDYKILEHYTCGILKVPALDAVRTPQGQIYERSAIVAWIHQKGTDPITRLPLKEEDLIDDNDSTLESSKKLIEAIEQIKPQVKQTAPELLDGLEALVMDLQANANRAYNKKLVDLQKKLEKEEISVSEYRSEAKALSEKFFS